MAWTLELTGDARTDLEKAGTTAAQRILKFLYGRIRLL
jgi:hypothetical protein